MKRLLLAIAIIGLSGCAPDVYTYTPTNSNGVAPTVTSTNSGVVEDGLAPTVTYYDVDPYYMGAPLFYYNGAQPYWYGHYRSTYRGGYRGGYHGGYHGTGHAGNGHHR